MSVIFQGLQALVSNGLEVHGSEAPALAAIGVSTYHVTRELSARMQEQLPSVEDLQEIVDKLRLEMETLRWEVPDDHPPDSVSLACLRSRISGTAPPQPL